MAPVQPIDISSDDESDTDLTSGNMKRLQDEQATNYIRHIATRHGVDMDIGQKEDRKYDSEGSAASESNSSPDSSVEELEDIEAEASEIEAPLLPDELLKPLPSPAYSPQQVVSIPWNQMTRKQKRAERTRSIQAKKMEWDRLREETRGTGVLEAGRVAQLKRGIVAKGDKVRSGRIAKKTKPQASGRQRLLEERKRAGERSGRGDLRPPKKAKTTSKG